MSQQREAIIKQVRDLFDAKPPVSELFLKMVNNFDEYLRDGTVESLPLNILRQLVHFLGPKGEKLTGDQVCRLFVLTVPYNEMESLSLLSGVNFHNVSSEVLQSMRVIPYGDGKEMKNPFVTELLNLRNQIDEFNECARPRYHDFDEKGICKRCKQGKCVTPCENGLSAVHKYGEDGRCAVCGEPRCRYDNLHPYNYDGHCHICGKAQVSRCEAVGCQRVPGSDKCPICGKALPPE